MHSRLCGHAPGPACRLALFATVGLRLSRVFRAIYRPSGGARASDSPCYVDGSVDRLLLHSKGFPPTISSPYTRARNIAGGPCTIEHVLFASPVRSASTIRRARALRLVCSYHSTSAYRLSTCDHMSRYRTSLGLPYSRIEHYLHAFGAPLCVALQLRLLSDLPWLCWT